MKKITLLSLAAIAALASDPLEIQKITVEAAAPKTDVVQNSTPAPSAATTMKGDSATLLSDAPGISLYTGGGISSLPVIHGMADDRVKIDIDGKTITSACPNHMNPALSYIDTTKIETMDVMAGITPVSQGGDSIGGTIVVESRKPVFAQKEGDVVMSGELNTFYRSNNDARGGAVHAQAANDKISVSYSGYIEEANNYKDGDGNEVKDTLYKNDNQTATIAYKMENGVISLEGGISNVDYEGFPNQYMDMLDNKGTSGNLSYDGKIGNVTVDANVFEQHTTHYMNKIESERTGNMPMYTDARETGYNISASTPLSDVHVIKVGTDFDKYRLDDWWPAAGGTMMGMNPNTFQNINNGKRDRIGLFAESDYQWSDKFSTLIGIRGDFVSMDTGDVHGYNNITTGTMMQLAMANDPRDATAFNSLDHSKEDNNLDFTLAGAYEYSDTTDLELGFARKTRSPNIYERYSWAGGYSPATTVTASGPIAMDMAMINWFGDGNGYVGNLDLDPEVAYTLSATATLHDASQKEFEIKFTPYYTKVNDYIDVDTIGTATKGGYAGIQLLQVANHDAHLFGADLSGYAALWNNANMGTGTLKSSLGITRGFRDDGGSLYHMMPFYARMSLDHAIGGWNNGIDIQAVAEKSSVDSTRVEPTTPGYALVDLRASYAFTDNIKLDLASTNLFDKAYELPLGGVDVVNYSKTSYTPLQGMGRSYNVALNLKF
jgi:iron complex outermembrane receptor protein